MAPGMTLRGLGDSATARPTTSVPAMEKAAVTKTAATPLNPLASGPGCEDMVSMTSPQQENAVTHILPVPISNERAKFAVFRSSAEYHNEAEETEQRGDKELDAACDELFLDHSALSQ